MSFINSGQQIQLWIGEYGNTGRTYEVIDWVLDISANNRIGFVDSDLISTEKGKLRQLKVSYFPILAYDDVACAAKLCDTGTKVEPKQVTFNLKECTSTPVYSLDKDDIRYIDGAHTFSDIAKSAIASALPQWRRNWAIDMLTKISANLGIFLDGNPTHQVQPSVSTTGQINPAGMWQIDRDFQDGGLMDPFILGNVDVDNWRKSFAVGGLNLQGQQINKLDVPNLYYDSGLLDLVLGDTTHGGHIIAIDAQVMKYVSFSENAGIFATEMQSIDQLNDLYWRGNDSFINGTFYEPVTKVLLDFNAKYDPCGGSLENGSWNFTLKHRWDIFFLPEVAVNAVGPAYNGILHYRTCVPKILACPEGTAFSPAIAATTYTWTPSFPGTFTLPYMVLNTLIGGVTDTFANGERNITNMADLVSLMNDAANGIEFTTNGTWIRYTGHGAISGNFNNGDVSFSFATV